MTQTQLFKSLGAPLANSRWSWGSVRSSDNAVMVMCLAEDVTAVLRTIKSFNKDEVFVGGEVIDLNGDTWVQRAGRKPVAEVKGHIHA